MKVPVLVPKVFNFPFTYNSGLLENLKPGDIVIVPFGKSKEIGVIWDKIQPSVKKFKLRNVEKKIDNFKIDKNLCVENSLIQNKGYKSNIKDTTFGDNILNFRKKFGFFYRFRLIQKIERFVIKILYRNRSKKLKSFFN